MAYANAETDTLAERLAADPVYVREIRQRTEGLRLKRSEWTAESVEFYARRARGPILEADAEFDWDAVDFQALADEWNALA